MGRRKSDMPTEQIRIYKKDKEELEALAKLMSTTYAEAVSYLIRQVYEEGAISKALSDATKRLGNPPNKKGE